MKNYIIKITSFNSIPLDGMWEKAQTLELCEFPWSASYPYKPKTLVRMLHNDEDIFIRFDVWEKNIRATYTLPNDPVSRDSCVEFFFTPNQEENHYLSFEINPLGALLIGIGTSGSDLQYLTEDRAMFQIQTRLLDEHWLVSYKIPYKFVNNYFTQITKNWRGNFMKCASASKTPHYGSWNLIQTDIPKFHMPQFFGSIKLE